MYRGSTINQARSTKRIAKNGEIKQHKNVASYVIAISKQDSCSLLCLCLLSSPPCARCKCKGVYSIYTSISVALPGVISKYKNKVSALEIPLWVDRELSLEVLTI